MDMVFSQKLDLMILEVFSNLNDSVILLLSHYSRWIKMYLWSRTDLRSSDGRAGRKVPAPGPSVPSSMGQHLLLAEQGHQGME